MPAGITSKTRKAGKGADRQDEERALVNPILAVVATATYRRIVSLVSWALLVSGSSLRAHVRGEAQ